MQRKAANEVTEQQRNDYVGLEGEFKTILSKYSSFGPQRNLQHIMWDSVSFGSAFKCYFKLLMKPKPSFQHSDFHVRKGEESFVRQLVKEKANSCIWTDYRGRAASPL